MHAHAPSADALQFPRSHAPQPARDYSMAAFEHVLLLPARLLACVTLNRPVYYGWMNSKATAEGRKCNGYLCYETVGAAACMALLSRCAGTHVHQWLYSHARPAFFPGASYRLCPHRAYPSLVHHDPRG
jgi:hypothetical protein